MRFSDKSTFGQLLAASVSESYKVPKNEVVKHDAPHVFFLPNALLVLESDQKKNLTRVLT